MSSPTISICIPAYNCELFIEKTLKALLDQTYSKLDIVVVNDGSTDRTLEKIISIKDPRLKILDIENGGAARARNVAYQNSVGTYVVFFDADDLIDNDFLEKQFDLINHKENIVVVSGWGRFYNGDLKSFKKEFTPSGEISFTEWITNYWFNANPMTTPGRIMIPRAIIEKSGHWDETLTVNDDLDFFTRIFLQVDKLTFNPSTLMYYRSGVNGLSGNKGPSAYSSLYHSVINSIKKVLIAYPDNEMIAKSCANMLQSCIYEIYPHQKKLIRSLEYEITLLGRSSLKPFAGGITKYLNYVFGWKAVRVIKRFTGFEN